MKVIPFPGAQPLTSKGLKIEILDGVTNKITIGKFSVTCPNCEHHNHFDSKDTIFKTLEFFCGGCGHAIKVTNSALRTKFINRKF